MTDDAPRTVIVTVTDYDGPELTGGAAACVRQSVATVAAFVPSAGRIAPRRREFMRDAERPENAAPGFQASRRSWWVILLRWFVQ